MKPLNKIRLLSGLPMDLDLEREPVTEARKAPMRMGDLTPATAKAMAKGVSGLSSAVKHIEQAIKALEKIPSVDYNAVVPRYITELEDLLAETPNGMKAHLKMCTSAAKKAAKSEAAEPITEDEIIIDEDELDAYFNQGKDAEDLDESMMYYNDMNKDFEDDPSKPINVSDGSSNSEQVWDEPMDPKNTKDESPEQLRTGDEQSEQDQSDGLDIEADMKIPAGIKSQLTAAIKDAKAESDKMSVSNKDASYFYNDLARAFQDLKDHLDKGTRYDFKLAQTYAQSLMGPMIHKLPTDVWKFLTNGGATRSLKDYMKPVKDPITGPRNTIK